MLTYHVHCSHLHNNVPMRFLTCEPNLQHNATYVDEAELFYANPGRWLERDYPLRKSVPSHIVSFEVLQPQIEAYLTKHSYTLQHKLFHAHASTVSGRVGQYVLVHRAGQPPPAAPEPKPVQS
jgi:phosphatidylinositol glycan class B